VRYVFDEGHHLFDAADSGFAALISGAEMADLRRWIRGRRDARAAACAGCRNG
jgi:ATP-dependent DNA helicase DinG